MPRKKTSNLAKKSSQTRRTEKARDKETLEQREARLADKRERTKKARDEETLEEKEARLVDMRKRAIKTRQAETRQDRAYRLDSRYNKPSTSAHVDQFILEEANSANEEEAPLQGQRESENLDRQNIEGEVIDMVGFESIRNIQAEDPITGRTAHFRNTSAHVDQVIIEETNSANEERS